MSKSATGSLGDRAIELKLSVRVVGVRAGCSRLLCDFDAIGRPARLHVLLVALRIAIILFVTRRVRLAGLVGWVEAVHPLVVCLWVHPCLVVGVHPDPGIVEQLLRRRPVLRVPLEASLEEASHKERFCVLQAVLLHEDLLQLPLLQLLDALQLAVPVEKFRRRFALAQEAPVLALANQLANCGQMVVVLGVRLALLGVKEVVTGHKLEDHACQGPDIGGRVVFTVEDDLGRSVLPCLDHIRVVFVGVAGVTHIDDLDVEHAVADLLQLGQDLGLQLEVHPCATVGMDVAHHP